MSIVESQMSHNEWYALADEYYIAARTLQWFSGVNYPPTYAGHHALELYLKAILVKETNLYDDNQHDIRKLYKKVIETNPKYKNEDVESSIDMFWNYDQPARYTTATSRLKPENNSMGTDNLHALDAAVAILRDLSVTTRKGLDRIIAGESEFTKQGMSDPHLALNSVIVFYFNNALKPKNPDVMKQVEFKAPTYLI